MAEQKAEKSDTEMPSWVTVNSDQLKLVKEAMEKVKDEFIKSVKEKLGMDWPSDGYLVKEAMEKVKDEFIKSVKEKLGMDWPSDGYHIQDVGLRLDFLLGAEVFVGAVKTAAPGMVGGYHASVRMGRMTGTEKPQPFTVSGYIVSMYGSLQPVNDGEYVFHGLPSHFEKASGGKFKAEYADKAKASVAHKGLPFGWGAYTPGSVSYAQELLNGTEREVLKKAGLEMNGVSQFRVVDALVRGSPAGFKFGDWKARVV
eukprot:CAMPEP_0197073022 /NCGR_PEP_ID=MMETSP1384-20130603/210394_1 /TAXON_ID=29189 /ORGANISM="Ammonia sp." /LENGTH=255 /DNA_ID=CAMNT_0042511847 /DNA_START=139 /DNA_END=903 /DNA_ORIENTATION=-